MFITHNHYDHYSEEDIDKVIKSETVFVAPESLFESLLNKGVKNDYIVTVKPNVKYIAKGVKFETVPAYNINKKFHPKENNWVGYIIEINRTRYYVAGDTDITDENKNIKCDVAFLPVGGTYTMNYKEAASLANILKPKIAVPIHYGSVVGTMQNAQDFIELLDKDIKGISLIK